jgi:hypothetical protein
MGSSFTKGDRMSRGVVYVWVSLIAFMASAVGFLFIVHVI